jgi:hypothetical protein
MTPRPMRKQIEKPRGPSPVLDIPYFAHMPLNPARYPPGKPSHINSKVTSGNTDVLLAALLYIR